MRTRRVTALLAVCTFFCLPTGRTALAEDPVAKAPSDPSSAVDTLTAGINTYYAHHRPQAAELLHQALRSGALNTQGRTLAYWYLFLSEQRGADDVGSAETLASFVALAQQIMQSAPAVNADDAAGQFVEGFQLKERLRLAELMLDALWAHRDVNYGRTPERPVMVGDARARKIFIALYQPCGSDTPEHEVEFTGLNQTSVDRAVIRCGASKPKQTADFYFAR